MNSLTLLLCDIRRMDKRFQVPPNRAERRKRSRQAVTTRNSPKRSTLDSIADGYRGLDPSVAPLADHQPRTPLKRVEE